MPVIGLSGPNAIGKTTAVTRWLARYSRLVGAFADNQREARAGELHRVMASPPNVRTWKGTAAEKEALVDLHRRAGHIAVIDSARTTALNFFLPGEPIILLVCSGETMGRMLRLRCTQRKKRYREDCWTADKLAYEGRRRYEGFAARFPALDVRMFSVEDYERDWPAVDTYFGSVYRQLLNRLNRRDHAR